jgi:hypothetical protein
MPVWLEQIAEIASAFTKMLIHVVVRKVPIVPTEMRSMIDRNMFAFPEMGLL